MITLLAALLMKYFHRGVVDREHENAEDDVIETHASRLGALPVGRMDVTDAQRVVNLPLLLNKMGN